MRRKIVSLARNETEEGNEKIYINSRKEEEKGSCHKTNEEGTRQRGKGISTRGKYACV